MSVSEVSAIFLAGTLFGAALAVSGGVVGEMTGVMRRDTAGEVVSVLIFALLAVMLALIVRQAVMT